MRITEWSRMDQVLLEGVLWAVPMVGVLSLTPGIADAVRGRPLEVGSTAVDGRPGTVVLPDPTAGQYLLALTPPLLAVLLLGTGSLLLLGVARALRHGDPFTPASARRLTLLGVVVLVGGLLGPVVAEALRVALVESARDAVPAGSFSLEVELHAWPVLTGMLVLFVAEVFRRGAALRADVEGLV